MSTHLIGRSPSGLIDLHYQTKAENLAFTMRGAKLWRFLVDSEGTLAQFREIAEAVTPEASRDDLMWIADALASAETWLDTIPHDLATYGEIGVSF